jgi:hypothetical protein
MRPAMDSFSDREFEPAFQAGGPSSATRLLVNDMDRVMAELRRFSAPLWSFSANTIPPEHHRGIHHIEVVGVDKASGEVDAIRSRHSSLTVMPTGWSERVVHLQIRAGIPLFALTCMGDLWRDYTRRRGRPGRELFHVDRRWVGWPELLPHSFDEAVLGAFAQGLTSEQITVTATEIAYDDGNSPSILGESFQEAFRALSRNAELQKRLSRTANMTNAGSSGTRIAAALWKLLVEDQVPVDDRSLVEALLLCVERPVARGAAAR